MMNFAKNLRTRTLALPFALVITALIGAIPASASSIAWTAPGDVTGTSGFNLVGDVFTANSNETVNALGIFVLPYTSFEVVGLFDMSGNELADASINALAPQSDSYYWQSISGVQLNAGQSYTLVVYTNGSNPGYGTSNTNPTNGWATFDYGVSGNAAVGDFPNSTTLPTLTQTSTGFYGANLQASPTLTPEPESLLLLGSGLIGLAGFVRLKLRKN